jgi:hypothetical protein
MKPRHIAAPAYLAVLALFLGVSAQHARASLIGDTIQISEVNTSLDSDGLGTGVVNPFLEFPPLTHPFDSMAFNIGVTSSGITWSLGNGSGYIINPFAHVNYLVSDLTKPLASAAVDASTTLPAFTDSNLQFLPGSHDLLVDFAALGNGFRIPPGSRIVIDLNAVGGPAPVPEPAALELLGAGLVGLGLIRCRRGRRTSPNIPRG